MEDRFSLFVASILVLFASFSSATHADASKNSVIAKTQIEISHSLGKVQLDGTPKRVVVIGVGPLDALDRFGIEPVSVSQVATLPEYLAKYKGKEYGSSGSLFEPDFEAIYTQKPDVIIVGARGVSSYEELTKIAPTIVFSTDANKGYWESTQQQWHNLGEVFDIADKVTKKISDLDKQFEQIRRYNEKNKVDALTVMSAGGNLTAFGEHSRFSSVYHDFGFSQTVEGIREASHGDLISYEFIAKSNPSTLLVIDRDVLVNAGKSKVREAFENDLVKATKAYKNGQVVYLDVDAWYLSIAGVTATEQMIEDVQHAIGLN
ncbi:siderophore ABC transporter substrate-binding protein [uncultured Vibrio sp.]|uniref:siderophore ABC transporter substrate-binding protein n=1 Tax=uncultured Vibrio sp. TaxID=114054 RepID=UPI0025E017EB|nr:siderophore ABC transporter substrate-binding protein [uncultured Vibrio sp.]